MKMGGVGFTGELARVWEMWRASRDTGQCAGTCSDRLQFSMERFDTSVVRPTDYRSYAPAWEYLPW